MQTNGYVLDRTKLLYDIDKKVYYQEDLVLMTTFQLREICRKEKIINGVINKLDKEELILRILKFCGNRDPLIIGEESKEGRKRLESLFNNARIIDGETSNLGISSKITVFQGLQLTTHDGILLPYNREFIGTNAFIVSEDFKICGFFYIDISRANKNTLFLLSNGKHAYTFNNLNKYELYCFNKKESDLLYRVYYGKTDIVPEHLKVHHVPIIDFCVKNPLELKMPIAIDFGSTNTTTGVFLDSQYFDEAGTCDWLGVNKKSQIYYTTFCDFSSENNKEKKTLPSVAGVSFSENKPNFTFGYEAVRVANSSYVDEGFGIFYDLKRWVGDYEKEEVIFDRDGRRCTISRKEILKAFFLYIIDNTQNKFKCKIGKIHISCPVKQKFMFYKFFKDILADYILPIEDSVDEGVAVLYNTISEMIINKKEQQNLTESVMEDGDEYEALLIDCGGGTTDLSACKFRVWDKRISYKIEMLTAYENGDTDFGGNNLTYRIMQYLKIILAEACGYEITYSSEQILNEFDIDIFRFIDKYGTQKLYSKLEDSYESTEKFIPTCFKMFETHSSVEYFMVKNNFYYLYFLAEEIKKQFYNTTGTIKAIISSNQLDEDGKWIKADKWKLSVYDKRFITLKLFPVMRIYKFAIELLLKGDIYGVIKKFLEPLYLSDRMSDFSFIKMTGQSCKIDIFKDALKEYVPGKMVQFKRRTQNAHDDEELKMTCLDGALKYIRDKQCGYIDVTISSDKPILPYTVSSYKHNGQEVELINGFLRQDITKSISRNLDNVTLQLFLKDTEGRVRHSFYYNCFPNKFSKATYEEIHEIYGDIIPQKDTDNIINGEVKFFLWKKCREWGYCILPIYRKDDSLFVGYEKFYPFENEGWILNFFDGKK